MVHVQSLLVSPHTQRGAELDFSGQRSGEAAGTDARGSAGRGAQQGRAALPQNAHQRSVLT